MAYFSYLLLELNAVSSEQVFRSIVVLKIYTVATFEGKIINTIFTRRRPRHRGRHC